MSKYILYPSNFFLELFSSVYYYLIVSENYLKVSEVAKRYDVTVNAVKGWIKQGLLPNAKFEQNIVGSIWLVPESDLKDFQKPEMGRPKKKDEEKESSVKSV